MLKISLSSSRRSFELLLPRAVAPLEQKLAADGAGDDVIPGSQIGIHNFAARHGHGTVSLRPAVSRTSAPPPWLRTAAILTNRPARDQSCRATLKPCLSPRGGRARRSACPGIGASQQLVWNGACPRVGAPPAWGLRPRGGSAPRSACPGVGGGDRYNGGIGEGWWNGFERKWLCSFDDVG